jgi:hypothetical protein
MMALQPADMAMAMTCARYVQKPQLLVFDPFNRSPKALGWQPWGAAVCSIHCMIL